MSVQLARQIVSSISILSAVDRIEPIEAGYSPDEKYVLWLGRDPKYLLRLSDIQHWKRRQADFEVLGVHRKRGALCPEPYLFGATDDGKWCYSLLGFIIGRNAEQALPELSEEVQFDIGLQAGRELWELHQLPFSDEAFDWPGHRRAKHGRNVNKANDFGLTFPRQREVSDFIEANLGLLDRAPVRFQHDDYHLANLIVHNGKLAGVVDFNSCDWGDPVEDFYKLPWFTVPISKPFARGQVKGYLESGTPTSFWRRYNLFAAMSITSSLVWSTEFYPEQMDMFRRRTDEILETHDLVGGGAPSWMGEDSGLG